MGFRLTSSSFGPNATLIAAPQTQRRDFIREICHLGLNNPPELACFDICGLPRLQQQFVVIAFHALPKS